MALFLVIGAAILMTFVFNITSQFQRNIKSGVQETKSISDKVELKQTVRSLPELKCKIGSFYHMEGKAKLTIVDKIAQGICFTLLSK